ncbi:MAG TPA: TonB-dependent receptor [Rhizomicrobium sp.]|nr:TonB-dependent receptor [Rhizomicrobium sp.]
MSKVKRFKTILAMGVCIGAMTPVTALAREFNVPGGDLEAALTVYTAQAGVALAVPSEAVKGVHTKGATGDYSPEVALAHILRGTGFSAKTDSAGVIQVMSQPTVAVSETHLAQAAPARAAGIESVVVTSSKIKGDIQTVPIAITALSQEQLTSRQIAGGPDLVKEVPNLTFSKTNFTGYNIQIRGIGTQAISVTTDPAVAVAFNDMPFIRNHFFEQEFYDVSQVEVLRGPQGTLYGRNATAGVVNIVSAKPTDQFEAMASADFGNFHNRRFEGMINVPIDDDRIDIRAAAEWTKRDGYSFNSFTNAPIDGRDLWSSRVTLGFKPTEDLQAYLVWEHFSESDDRLRSGKQLCKTDVGPGGTPLPPDGHYTSGTVDINGIIEFVGPGFGLGDNNNGNFFLQGCVPASLYSTESFEAPLGFALPYIVGGANPYSIELQSRNLRVINSQLNPVYRAKNDTVEFNVDYILTPALTFSSQTGYNQDFLWSTEDFNRFGSIPGFFGGPPDDPAVFCDPQLGCANRLVAEDLSDEHAWQLSQEFRLASNFSGPLNFSVGANYLHYETLEDYYVFINEISNFVHGGIPPWGYQYSNPDGKGISLFNVYTDPTPLDHLAGDGHNYYRNENPYVLNSYAGFGEAYYNVTNDLKFTGGLRWTDDRKHFLMVPSWIAADGYGYPVAGIVDQQWNQLTGRAVANWTPKLDFTDQTLVYGSFSHGYKAGGANPPGAVFGDQGALNPVHPLTFKPEFVDAYELGTKNTLLDGGLTLNGDVFFYNYKGYQISEIVDRTAINHNYDATVKGAELESTWEPAPGLKFSFAGGYEATRIDNGQSAVDLMDRTAGNTGWYVSKPFISQASNCIFPGYVAQWLLHGGGGSPGPSGCELAYEAGIDPVSGAAYKLNPTSCYDYYNNGNPDPAGGGCPPSGYAGFDPFAGTPGDPYTGQNTSNGIDYGPAPNDGQGFSKNLGGNQLPNAPHFTTSLSAEYTLPVSEDWAATLHSDFYWQSQSWWRVFNDKTYDKIRGYSNVNVALILTSANGWQVLGYVKNIFDTTAVTGAFLNSDDTGLTTNVFLTDPRLYGVRITKNW